MAIVPGLPTCAPRLSRLSMLDRMRMPPCLLGLLAALAGPAAAEEKPGEKLVAFKAARIHPVSGPAVAPGILVVRGKLVEAVLPGSESPPAGAEVVDLGDAVVLPGLVNPLSAISEGNYRRGGVGNLPSAGAGAPRDARGHVALSSLKPDDTVHRRLARTGYAALGWLPDPSGFLAGQASVLRPRAGREKDAAALSLKDSAYLLMSFELGKRWRDAVEGELRKAAEAIAKEAKEAEEKKKAAEKKPEEKKPDDKKPEEKKPEEKKDEKKDEKKPEEKPQPKPGEKKDAPQAPQPAQPPQAPAPPQPPRPPDPLVRALKGEVPLVVRVRSPAALDHFFRLLDALSLKPRFVLVTAPQAPATVERLARRRDRIEAVVLEPRVETVDETSVLSSAARLFWEKGFPVALVPLSDTLEGHERMLFHLAELVKSGLPEATALRVVTAEPARILGLEGKLGVLAKGAFASFAAYRGDPLGGAARLERVYLEGVEAFHDDAGTLKLSGEAVR